MKKPLMFIVLSLMISALYGKEHDAWACQCGDKGASYWGMVDPACQNGTVHSAIGIVTKSGQPASLLSSDIGHYHYNRGSLATPPCSVKAKSYIIKESISIDKTQFETFRKRYATNFRPVQPLNGRSVEVR